MAMIDFINDEEIRSLKAILGEYENGSALEFESLEDYPFVFENLKRRNIILKRPSALV